MRDDPDSIKPIGEMELMTVESAAEEILRIVKDAPSARNINLNGKKVPAELAKDLIMFGKTGSLY